MTVSTKDKPYGPDGSEQGDYWLSYPKKEKPKEWYHNVYEGWCLISREDDYDTDKMSWEKLRYLLTLKYGPPISGGWTRLIWKTKNGNVVKLSFPGCHCSNEREHTSPFEYKAKTRLHYIERFPLLFMEELILPEDLGLEEIPRFWWTGFVDCSQIGLNRKGAWVAYDLGG